MIHQLAASISNVTVHQITSVLVHKKGKGIAHRREHAFNVLSSLTRAAGRTATACSLQTQAGAAAG